MAIASVAASQPNKSYISKWPRSCEASDPPISYEQAQRVCEPIQHHAQYYRIRLFIYLCVYIYICTAEKSKGVAPFRTAVEKKVWPRFGSVAILRWNGSSSSASWFRLCSRKGFFCLSVQTDCCRKARFRFGAWKTVPAAMVPLSVRQKAVPMVPGSGSVLAPPVILKGH